MIDPSLIIFSYIGKGLWCMRYHRPFFYTLFQGRHIFTITQHVLQCEQGTIHLFCLMWYSFLFYNGKGKALDSRRALFLFIHTLTNFDKRN